MARSKTYRETVCVLSAHKLGEQDLILMCITNKGSKLQAVVKGGRKPTSKLAGAVMQLSIVDGLFARGKTLDILTDAKVITPSPKELRELSTNAAIAIIAELTRSLIFEDAEDPFIYNLFIKTSAEIIDASYQKNQAAITKTLIAAFIFKLFAHLGWYPKITHCAMCNSPNIAAFDHTEGGALCQACAENRPHARYINQQELQLLQAFLTKRLSDLVTNASEAPAKTCLHIAFDWAATHGGMRLKSAEFYLHTECNLT